MSVKRYGIYLCYPPTVDLRKEGLGRYLAELVRAAIDRRDVRFVIACPSWMIASLRQLFRDARIDWEKLEFLHPPKPPMLLTVRLFILTHMRIRPIFRARWSLVRRLSVVLQHFRRRIETKFATTRSLTVLVMITLLSLPILLIGAVVRLVGGVIGLGKLRIDRASARMSRSVRKQFRRFIGLLVRPQDHAPLVRLYRTMMEREGQLIADVVAKRNDVVAWYCPTAFWPHFNKIQKPRLMCVPDVVLADFPIGYALVGGSRYMEVFKDVELAIAEGEHFVTFSEAVKWQTLVRRYNVDPRNVHVIPHGANQLENQIAVRGMPDNKAASTMFCRNVFRAALNNASSPSRAPLYGDADIRFLFYASQFRPHKNIIGLLRAYKRLLRDKHIEHKLVLTGNINVLPEVQGFIADHRLENDILCLRELSSQELAACYHLSDLVVNPSLFEGGFPFTFAEALSVGTPVVMARIAVTEEVITDPTVADKTLFEPYDWQSMADRIEWALRNRAALYALQRKYFDDVIAPRTWHHTLQDYLNVLELVSSRSVRRACS